MLMVSRNLNLSQSQELNNLEIRLIDNYTIFNRYQQILPPVAPPVVRYDHTYIVPFVRSRFDNKPSPLCYNTSNQARIFLRVNRLSYLCRTGPITGWIKSRTAGHNNTIYLTSVCSQTTTNIAATCIAVTLSIKIILVLDQKNIVTNPKWCKRHSNERQMRNMRGAKLQSVGKDRYHQSRNRSPRPQCPWVGLLFLHLLFVEDLFLSS